MDETARWMKGVWTNDKINDRHQQVLGVRSRASRWS